MHDAGSVRVMALFIEKSEVAELLSVAETIDAVEEAFRTMDGAIVPPRIQLKRTRHGEYFFMPGTLGPEAVAGLKTVTIFPGNEDRGLPGTLGSICLFDGKTGALTAILDGTHITNYRTGAIGAVAARHLATEDASTVGIIGSGTQARYQALALDTELALETIEIYSRSAKKHEAVEFLSPRVDAEVLAAATPSDACRGAAIVVAATVSPVPVFADADLEPGSLVIGIGSNDADMREIPGETMSRATGVYVDDIDLCLGVGDIADAIDEGHLSKPDVRPMTSLLGEDPPYRQTPDQVFVVKSVGSIVLDLQVATLVLERARELGIGSHVDLQGLG